MTGTGRRPWLVGVGTLIVVVALTACVVRRDGGRDAGSDTTPIARTASVGRLAELVGDPAPVDPATPASLGAALGTAGGALSSPQAIDAFRATYGTGPRDLASQIGTYLAALAADVSPPTACGIRSSDLIETDTAYVLQLATAAAVTLRPDLDPVAAIAAVLPRGLEESARAEVVDAIVAGDATRAADVVHRTLGDRAARAVVGGLVTELGERLSATGDADYLSDFTAAVNFVGNVESLGDTCS